MSLASVKGNGPWMRHCSQLIDYVFATKRAAIMEVKKVWGKDIRVGTEAPARSGPCVPDGWHTNVYEAGGKHYVCAITSCPCYDGDMRTTRFRVIWAR
jgi:hypothetical protein